MAASWKDLKRHPLSAEYEDITGPAWYAFTLFLKNNGIVGDRKIMLHEGMVLDGWQLLRGCIECNIEPEFETLPEGKDPEQYVIAVNDRRRQQESQETINRRAEARRVRVAKAVNDGKSQSSIAREEHVSRKTIEHDIKKINQHEGVAPPKEKVTGSDGKKYPGKKRKIRCAGCMRLWPDAETTRKDCPACVTANQPAEKQEAETEKPPAEPQPTQENPAPAVPRVKCTACKGTGYVTPEAAAKPLVTLEEVTAYCKERAALGKKAVDPEAWYDHYTSNGWKVGRTKMKDWKAAVRTWEKTNFSNGGKKSLDDEILGGAKRFAERKPG